MDGGAGRTVRLASSLTVDAPAASVTVTEIRAPSSANEVTDSTQVGAEAHPAGAPFLRQAYENGSRPLATTAKLAACPSTTVADWGEAVSRGADCVVGAGPGVMVSSGVGSVGAPTTGVVGAGAASSMAAPGSAATGSSNRAAPGSLDGDGAPAPGTAAGSTGPPSPSMPHAALNTTRMAASARIMMRLRVGRVRPHPTPIPSVPVMCVRVTIDGVARMRAARPDGST